MPKKYTPANFEPLPNLEAIANFNGKTLMTSWHYFDVLAHEHAVAFTVAKMMDEDLLKETRDAIASALEDGTDFNTFKQRLKPYLMSKGWWGEQVVTAPSGDKQGTKQTVQLGSMRRLRTIYHTNKHTAYAAGQWERIQQTKDMLPYLQYMPSLSENKRLDHKKYYNLVREVDDAIWQVIYPPNGYGCKCWVKQLTKRQAEAQGITANDDLPIDDGVEASFAHNHVNRLATVTQVVEQKHGKAIATKIYDDAVGLLNSKRKLPDASEWQAVAKIGRELWERHLDVFEAVDMDSPHAFSHALLDVMRKEHVKTGAKANVVGDAVDNVAIILERYPATWVDKANEAGTIYVRNLTTRGFQIHIESEQVLKALQYHVKTDKDLKPFAKFADKFEVGDGVLKLNNMAGKSISNKAYDIALHEFGHRLQAVMPELDEYFKQLWIDRTKDEKTRPLAIIQKERGERPYYAQQEVGRKDDFVHVYFGRNYGTDDDPKPKELLTMTMQTILGSGQDQSVTIKTLFKDDPEMVYLGIALLLRYTP